MNSVDILTCFGDCPQAKKSKKNETPTTVTSTKWAYLPSIVIHKIFDLLSPKDRINASLVCKNWRQHLFHPKWWSSFKFKIDPDEIDRTKFCFDVFGHISTNACIHFNSVNPDCVSEFVQLLETLSENDNLNGLIIESTHCRIGWTEEDDNNKRYSYNLLHVIKTLKLCLKKDLTKFSIGCIEELASSLDEYLTILSAKQSNKITHLGLASVKDNPNEYDAPYFDNNLLKSFKMLQIISIDFDQLSDHFLTCLNEANDLQRLIVHLHGVRDGHPGTSNERWIEFKLRHPKCELRLNVIHSYDEVGMIQSTILHEQMPLTHLKVLFCEQLNTDAMDFMSASYSNTLRSIIWVDSINGPDNRAFLCSRQDDSPDPLIMMAWLCTQLEEIVFYGYKCLEDHLICVARLRGDKLKRFEVIDDDIVSSNDGVRRTKMRHKARLDVVTHLKRPWAPRELSSLPPVICNPQLGDSDEFVLPLIQADMH